MNYCALIRQPWYDSAKRHLTDMERLAFYEACFEYEFSGVLPSEATCKYSSVLLMFDMVKNDLAADREKAEKIAERARQNGMNGGRPRVNKTPQNEKTQSVLDETQRNPVGFSSSPLHYNTLHNNTQQAAIGGGSVLDLEFFDSQIWPRLNRSGKFNTRHRVCCVRWEEYTERKRAAIAKAVLSDVFTGADNPYYYLEDFAEPAPGYLSPKQCEEEWKAGRSVWAVRVGEVIKYVTANDLKEYGITDAREMPPKD